MMVNPGEQAALRWKATRAGVFLYHCAPGGSMTPLHTISGMSGAVMVLPREGLRDKTGKLLHYDRIYYIGENDFYVPRGDDGKFQSFTDASDYFPKTLELIRKLIPTHVVFEGKVGALTGKNALQAKVGETVLIVHSQANRDSRPHLIGGHGDYVWETGGFHNPPEQGLQTWFIRGGSAGAALYTFRQPGIYAYLSHNLIEAVELGAVSAAAPSRIPNEVRHKGAVFAFDDSHPTIGDRRAGRLAHRVKRLPNEAGVGPFPDVPR
jgi:nitrite reductase (NO-forming)